MFFFHASSTTEFHTYWPTLSLLDALPIWSRRWFSSRGPAAWRERGRVAGYRIGRRADGLSQASTARPADGAGVLHFWSCAHRASQSRRLWLALDDRDRGCDVGGAEDLSHSAALRAPSHCWRGTLEHRCCDRCS